MCHLTILFKLKSVYPPLTFVKNNENSEKCKIPAAINTKILRKSDR